MQREIMQREIVKSLSARRAWIEMIDSTHRREPFRVALRKESVDRNHSVRQKKIGRLVALRKESVDRNMLCLLFRLVVGCRSPQGERG